MALEYQIKARARREIEKAAEWWAENRQAVPGAIRQDIEAALKERASFRCGQGGKTPLI